MKMSEGPWLWAAGGLLAFTGLWALLGPRRKPRAAVAPVAPSLPAEPPAGFGPPVLLKGTEVHVIAAIAPQILDAPDSPEAMLRLAAPLVSLWVITLGKDQEVSDFSAATILQTTQLMLPNLGELRPQYLNVSLTSCIRNENGLLIPIHSCGSLITTQWTEQSGEASSPEDAPL